MIPFDFEYHRPDTFREAANLFSQLDSAGKAPVYYSGGSELISMARLGNLKFGAAIDIKSIPECKVSELDGQNLLLGAALTLSDITRANLFPLLGKAAGRIADHTMQCKITLGGNIASTIVYRRVRPSPSADGGKHNGGRVRADKRIRNQSGIRRKARLEEGGVHRKRFDR